MSSEWTPRTGGSATTMGELSEAEILDAFSSSLVLGAADVGPGDDAAVLPPVAGRTVVTTDSMVLGRDWRDHWSSAGDVGTKLVAQNIADIHAMGAHVRGIVVALAAEKDTRIDWLVELTRGMAKELRRAGTGTLGGDLSSVASGVVLTVTALGELEQGRTPMLRSNARIGDVVVVSDPLGRSQAGLTWLLSARPHQVPELAIERECVAFHRSPWPRYEAVDEAIEAGMRCGMDVSDGLVRDAARIAAASSVRIDLNPRAVREMAAPLVDVVADEATACVLSSGEEHALLGTCAPAHVPSGWLVIGQVCEGSGVTLAGEPVPRVGWDHFG